MRRARALIAAAFNAPLAGAFYAFELIIGSYTLATLVPVVVAAVMATLVTRDLFGEQPIFVVYYSHVDLFATNYLILAALGFCRGAFWRSYNGDGRGHLCRAMDKARLAADLGAAGDRRARARQFRVVLSADPWQWAWRDREHHRDRSFGL